MTNTMTIQEIENVSSINNGYYRYHSPVKYTINQVK